MSGISWTERGLQEKENYQYESMENRSGDPSVLSLYIVSMNFVFYCGCVPAQSYRTERTP